MIGGLSGHGLTVGPHEASSAAPASRRSQVRPAMLRALVVNSIMASTAALIGMGLLSGKQRNRCYSGLDGTPEPPPPGSTVGRACDMGNPGAFAGRQCPGGYHCLPLGAFSIWSYDSAPWAALSVLRLFFLHRWGEMYTAAQDATGTLGAGFVLLWALSGGLVTINIFVPLLVVQLEKMRSRSYLETGRRMIRRALNRRMAAAFIAWRINWVIAQQRMREAVRARAMANPDIAEKFANRLRGGGARLRAWNIWVAAIARPVLPLQVQALREALLDRDPSAVEPIRGEARAIRARQVAQRQVQAAKKAAAEAAAKLLELDAAQQVHQKPPCTPQQMHRWLLRVSESPRLQWSVTMVVVLSCVLMGCTFTCDSPPGLWLDCAPGSEGSWEQFEARVETTMLISSMLLVSETLLKLTVMGPLKFLYDPLNQIDLFISAVSLADMALSGSCRLAHPSGGGDCSQENDLRSLSALRSLRLVRVLRLLRSAPSLKALLIQLVDLVKSAWSLMLLIVLLAYTFALIGDPHATAPYAVAPLSSLSRSAGCIPE
jgi:hypothetical protein